LKADSGAWGFDTSDFIGFGVEAGEGEGRRKQQNRKIGRKLNLLRESFSRKNHQEQISL